MSEIREGRGGGGESCQVSQIDIDLYTLLLSPMISTSKHDHCILSVPVPFER